MTDQPLDDVPGDDPEPDTGGDSGTDPSAEARVEVLQAVVDRVVSWQEGSDDVTVRTELDDALAEAGVSIDGAARQRIVDRVTRETPHFDVREVV